MTVGRGRNRVQKLSFTHLVQLSAQAGFSEGEHRFLSSNTQRKRGNTPTPVSELRQVDEQLRVGGLPALTGEGVLDQAFLAAAMG